MGILQPMMLLKYQSVHSFPGNLVCVLDDDSSHHSNLYHKHLRKDEKDCGHRRYLSTFSNSERYIPIFEKRRYIHFSQCIAPCIIFRAQKYQQLEGSLKISEGFESIHSKSITMGELVPKRRTRYSANQKTSKQSTQDIW